MTRVKPTSKSKINFVYSDNDSLSVIFQDNDLLMGVVGEFNINLNKGKFFAIFKICSVNFNYVFT